MFNKVRYRSTETRATITHERATNSGLCFCADIRWVFVRKYSRSVMEHRKLPMIGIAQTQANVPRSVTSKSGTFTVLNKQKYLPRNFCPTIHDPKQMKPTNKGAGKPVDRLSPLPRPGFVRLKIKHTSQPREPKPRARGSHKEKETKRKE